MRTLRAVAAAAIVAVAMEAAIAHANDVKVVASGGAIKITGDADANQLTLDPAGGGVQITPGGGTTVNGAPGVQTFPTLTAGLKIALGGGDDVLLLDGVAVPGNLDIKAGDGADQIAIDAALVGGALKLDAGGGDDSVSICGGGIGGAATVKLGGGGGGSSSASCPGTDPASASTLDGNALVVRDLSLAKTLTVGGGKQNDAVTLYGDGVGGNVKVQLGAGAGGCSLCGMSIGGALSVQIGKSESTASGTCTTPMGNASANGQNGLAIAGGSAARGMTLKAGASTDAVAINNFDLGGTAKLDLGAGGNVLLSIDQGIAGDLVVKSGKGDDLVTLQNPSVQGTGKLTLGAGHNMLMATGSYGGDLVVKTGAGDDSIDVSGASVAGTKKIDSGNGSDTVLE